jgi:hypothetical protein
LAIQARSVPPPYDWIGTPLRQTRHTPDK